MTWAMTLLGASCQRPLIAMNHLKARVEQQKIAQQVQINKNFHTITKMTKTMQTRGKKTSVNSMLEDTA